MSPSDARLQEIRERLQRITPGDWSKGRAGNADVVAFDGEDVRGVAIVGGLGGNRSFIAHAPDDLRYLLDLVASLSARIAELESERVTKL